MLANFKDKVKDRMNGLRRRQSSVAAPLEEEKHDAPLEMGLGMDMDMGGYDLRNADLQFDEPKMVARPAQQPAKPAQEPVKKKKLPYGPDGRNYTGFHVRPLIEDVMVNDEPKKQEGKYTKVDKYTHLPKRKNK